MEEEGTCSMHILGIHAASVLLPSRAVKVAGERESGWRDALEARLTVNHASEAQREGRLIKSRFCC